MMDGSCTGLTAPVRAYGTDNAVEGLVGVVLDVCDELEFAPPEQPWMNSIMKINRVRMPERCTEEYEEEGEAIITPEADKSGLLI
jgi:hypothetical protein